MAEESEKTKKSPLKRLLIVVLSIVFFFVAVFAFMLISDAVAHSMARIVPDYEMDSEGLAAVLEKDKEDWTDDDYEFIYSQTGLTRAYFDGVTTVNTAFVMNCQADLFYDAEVEHDSYFAFSSHDYFKGNYFHMVDLRAGDVIISSSVHTMGWRNGHAAIVIKGGSSGSATIAEAVCVGTDSRISTTSWFRQASNFIVLRPKLSADESAEIAQWAADNMIGIHYSLVTGIFNAKDQTDDVQTTQCAHLVWQAYKAFGYDIDSTGGPVVTPRNIANCDLFEVIQVNGFDLESLWS